MMQLFNLGNVPLRGLQGCLLLFTIVSCQKLRPESVAIPEYPDFEELMNEQVKALGNSSVDKKVWLEGQIEDQTLKMDSIKWTEELSFLEEINPNRPEYVGAFEKSNDENLNALTLAEGESGALKVVKYAKEGNNYKLISATFHEDKDVYVHHREVEIAFEEGLINKIKIEGYQKMMFKDTVRFGVALQVD